MKTLRELFRDSRFTLGMAVLFVLGVLALLSFFSPYDPTMWLVIPRDLPPSWEHLLGTNSMGQDVFWKMTFAVRNSIVLAFLASSISRVIAVTVGLVAGYCGGVVDRVVMFVADTFLVLPLFLILMMIGVLTGRLGIVGLVLLFGLLGWAWDARVIRSQTLSLREREFTYTAILSGTPTRKLIFKEYLPFIIPLVLSTLISNMGWVIGMEITLAVIGFTDLLVPTLGAMLQWAISHEAMYLGLWWWLGTPIAATVLLLAALYLASVSISMYLDPRARIQRVGAR